MDRLRWVMATSLLKTLAAKHRSTAAKTAARYKAVIETPHGPRTCFEAVRIRDGNQKPLVARFGGIPLKDPAGLLGGAPRCFQSGGALVVHDLSAVTLPPPCPRLAAEWCGHVDAAAALAGCSRAHGEDGAFVVS
jgi:hypothetical protein